MTVGVMTIMGDYLNMGMLFGCAPYWHNSICMHFNNKVENKERPKPLSIPKLLEAAKSYKVWLARKRNHVDNKDDPSKIHCINV